MQKTKYSYFPFSIRYFEELRDDMVSLLFWNLNKKPLENIVAKIALRHNIDIIILIECSINPGVLLGMLNTPQNVKYHYSPSPNPHLNRKFSIFASFPPKFIAPKYENDRLTIRHLNLIRKKDILLAITHFSDKRNNRDSSQVIGSTILADYIRAEEVNIGHSRTVLVGDLNMNPFEEGVVSAKGLHGVMTRSIAKEGVRTVQCEDFPYFYNPMWSFFGDYNRGPPGTYYYRRSEQVVYFWNIFDQILIRPDLLDSFNNDDIHILDSDGENSLLLPNGIPNKKNFSDHLPIIFKLDL